MPFDVEKWYIEGYRKDFHNWLRMPLLKLRDASCLLYGKDPDNLPIGRDRPDGATWDNNSPGIDSLFTFYELARLAVLGGELRAIEDPQDPQGKVLVKPSAIFDFALKQGVFEFVPDRKGAKKNVLKIALRTVWKEAIAEQASIAESKTHEQSEHPSEEWITNKEAAQLYRTIRNASDRTARTAITDARISGKIKGKKKNSGHGYLVEKGSVMNFLDKLKEADSDKHDDFTVGDD